MAEISITPKRSAKNLPNLYDKTKTESRERKRNILYLILSYLTENRLLETAETLQNEADLTSQYRVCDNVDLDVILQEYQSYYYTKFQKYPKLVRKMSEAENAATDNKVKKRKSSAKLRHSENVDKNVSPPESEDFHFQIISLGNGSSNHTQELTLKEKFTYTFENYSSECKEMAEQIIKHIIPSNLGIKWNECIGLNNTIEKLKEATVYPILYPDLFKNLPPWKGILLYGPPGTGKTMLAKALASEGCTTFINVTSSTFISKWRGESEKMLQVLFDIAKLSAPTTIFIDELDALASESSQSQHEASRRFRSELLVQIDGILSGESNVFILGNTNVPWNLDAAILRRFEKRIFVDLPSEENRRQLLTHYIKQPHSLQKEEFQRLAEKMENFSGSDIKTLSKEAAMSIIRESIRHINKGNNNGLNLRKITYNDMQKALENIKPCTTSSDSQKYYEWTKKLGSY